MNIGNIDGTLAKHLTEDPGNEPPISRRAMLVRGTAALGGLLLRRAMLTGGATALGEMVDGNSARAQTPGLRADVKEYDISANGITLHVTEQGEGPAVLFCHGFPDTSYTWRRQMKVIAAAGYRAIAPDMRGYGRSSAPSDANLYTPLYTVGDLVGLLDAISVPRAVIVGHDWGSVVASSAALMRPDRFSAVLLMNTSYAPRGDASVLDHMRASGHATTFYMFEQIGPKADEIWSDAAITIPGVLYWASASAPADGRWNPLDPARSLYRRAPGQLPEWAERDYVAHNVAEFQRTGFHGGLNYYRAAQPFFDLSSPWKGAKITQPAFVISGAADGANIMFPTQPDQLRVGLPNLVGSVVLDNVGHWSQHEAANLVGQHLLSFLHSTRGSN